MFFPEIDPEKTKENAKRKLLEYFRLKRVAGADDTQKVTATYSFEPRQPHSAPSRPIENLVSRKVDASNDLEAIESAINRLGNPFARQILIERYCTSEGTRDKDVWLDLGYSETEYFREKDKALLYFAEAYKHGILLVEIGCNLTVK